MRTQRSDTMQRSRSGATRRGYQRSDRESTTGEPARLDVPRRPEARVREAGGPEDKALYTCSCGMVFDASVSTSVRCPNCGADQAW